jgi:glyoxylase-like metal-dependent hydrolase (beta-lactamase superfamily II)
MKVYKNVLGLACLLVICLIFSEPVPGADAIRLGPRITVFPGPVNSVSIEKAGHRLVVYGDYADRLTQAGLVLSTHARRDVVESARALVEGGARLVVPVNEVKDYNQVNSFWADFVEKRFHDYAQQSTRLLTQPIRVDHEVAGGNVINWQGVQVQVLATPGYTRGAVSYVVELDGAKLGFVGDCIFGDGQLLDLYSLQDAVPEANIRGYHGYAGRLGALIESLDKLERLDLDVMVPAHGPIIRNPLIAIRRLKEKVQAVYSNYLSINAGHWYFRENCDVLATRVLGDSIPVPWMPYAETIQSDPPAWIVPINNSRLVLSNSKRGFLVDCGSRGIVQRLKGMRDRQELLALDGVFITHYHDDHTDAVNELLESFPCPVYATDLLADVLKYPDAYRLPAMTSIPIPNLTSVSHGQHLDWREFALTFYDFPGQTIYHDALLVEKEGGQRILFGGDSFTPSGIDDYCLLNRNLFHPERGYYACLGLLRDLARPYLLINQHVREPFCFSDRQIDHMETVLQQREGLQAQLFPWPNGNYGIDEQWARFYPYGQQVVAGQSTNVSVCIVNHAPREYTYKITAHCPPELCLASPLTTAVRIPAGQERKGLFQLNIPEKTPAGIYVMTCDIQFGPWELSQWCEAMVIVK